MIVVIGWLHILTIKYRQCSSLEQRIYNWTQAVETNVPATTTARGILEKSTELLVFINVKRPEAKAKLVKALG